MDLGVLAGLADRIEWHDTIGSTNDRARELAQRKVPHGFVVGTDEQTAGRGRKGAEWVSEPGRGLAFSVIVRPAWPQNRWGWLSLAAGLAVCEGMEEMGFGPSVKWPNDVLMEGRKVCGILVEASAGSAVVGVGLNVNEREFPEGLEAVSLAQIRGEELRREEVLGVVWTRLLEVLERRPPAIAEAVWDRLAWRDEEVLVDDGERGWIRGFGENGELSVETADRLVTISQVEGLRRMGG